MCGRRARREEGQRAMFSRSFADGSARCVRLHRAIRFSKRDTCASPVLRTTASMEWSVAFLIDKSTQTA